jgi:hypothetical protein
MEEKRRFCEINEGGNKNNGENMGYVIKKLIT